MKTYGVLTLIPTPLSEEGELEPVAYRTLLSAAIDNREHSVFVIEDLKPGRKRWLNFKLPRECVDDFVLYNEHTAKTTALELLSALKSGKNVYLMSDGGLPAFYDPGVELVDLCHKNNIRVTSTPFFNSVVLALALSGFNHKKFWFEGFMPLESEERIKVLKNSLDSKSTTVLMDTPYRLKRVLEEMESVWGRSKKELFLACDLNKTNEELRRGGPGELLGAISDYKREFVLVVS